MRPSGHSHLWGTSFTEVGENRSHSHISERWGTTIAF